tara:strand:+ start:1042 stop:1953 length:912 start_codon:yes stop_codon:yes gene_type:complete
MEKDNNTQAQNELTSTSDDWTNEAFPEAHQTEEPGLEVEAETPELKIPDAAKAEVTDDNDQKRYQYWQSQADKMKAENDELKAAQVAQTNQAQQEVAPEPQVKEFPAPPEKPEKPRRFSREDAINNPDSMSARYNDAVDDWRDRMDKYNNLYAQYNVALAQERMEAMESKFAEKEQQSQAAAQNQQAMGELSEYVQATYGLSNEQTNDFIQTMSDPESLSIGNLVELYKMKGKQVINNVPTQVGTEVDNPQFASEPSDTFKQVKRAQQVPSPMGVLSGNRETKTGADSIMDEMIDTFNKKNPF